ncbi:MAG: hypothetical protein KDK25_00345 [Leptospiraceae bacterium]|nr:hypothetical protein [Leptospiraceae bacterium]
MAESQNPYQVSRASIETYKSVEEGIQYSFGRALREGLGAFFSTFPITFATGLIQSLIYMAGSGLLICGGFVILPHLFAGSVSYGSSAVNRQPKVEELFRPFNNFGPIFIAGLLYSLFFVAIFVVLFLVAALFGGLAAVVAGIASEASNAGDSGAEEALIGLGMLGAFGFIYLFLFYFLGRLDLTYPLIYELDISPWDAFVQSWRLTRGYGMSMFFTKLVVYLLPAIFALPLFGIFFSYFFLGAGFDADPDTMDAAPLFIGVFYVLMFLVIYPLAMGLRMTMEGAIANLFLTESVKQQLSPGYEERKKPQYVAAPPAAGSDVSAPASANPSAQVQDTSSPIPGSGSPSFPGSPTETSERGGDSAGDSRFGPSSGSSSDRFPREQGKDEGRKDPFNPYS